MHTFNPQSEWAIPGFVFSAINNSWYSFTDLEGWKAELTWVPGYRLPVRRQSPIPLLTKFNVAHTKPVAINMAREVGAGRADATIDWGAINTFCSPFTHWVSQFWSVLLKNICKLAVVVRLHQRSTQRYRLWHHRRALTADPIQRTVVADAVADRCWQSVDWRNGVSCLN